MKDHGYRAEMEVSLLHIAALYQGAIGSLPQPIGNEKKKIEVERGDSNLANASTHWLASLKIYLIRVLTFDNIGEFFSS